MFFQVDFPLVFSLTQFNLIVNEKLDFSEICPFFSVFFNRCFRLPLRLAGSACILSLKKFEVSACKI